MAVGPICLDASFATCLCTADGVMAPSATHIVALGGIRMMLASLPWGLTGISIFHFTFGWPHGGRACVFVCFLFDVDVHGGWCYGTQCYAHASLRWLPDLDGLVPMGLNLDTVSFLMR